MGKTEQELRIKRVMDYPLKRVSRLRNLDQLLAEFGSLDDLEDLDSDEFDALSIYSMNYSKITELLNDDFFSAGFSDIDYLRIVDFIASFNTVCSNMYPDNLIESFNNSLTDENFSLFYFFANSLINKFTKSGSIDERVENRFRACEFLTSKLEALPELGVLKSVIDDIYNEEHDLGRVDLVYKQLRQVLNHNLNRDLFSELKFNYLNKNRGFVFNAVTKYLASWALNNYLSSNGISDNNPYSVDLRPANEKYVKFLIEDLVNLRSRKHNTPQIDSCFDLMNIFGDVNQYSSVAGEQFLFKKLVNDYYHDLNYEFV